jgi:predicted dehydrogenase
LPEDQQLDYIVIVTPNHVHYDPAMKRFKAGIAVFCEKPLCINLKEASDIVKAGAQIQGSLWCGAHLPGPLDQPVLRYIVRAGSAGRRPLGGFLLYQGWLATKLEATGQMQAAWRTNPKLAGASGCGGDIGTHALMQLRYVTGLEVEQVSANLEKFVEGRPIDDHFTTYCK